MDFVNVNVNVVEDTVRFSLHSVGCVVDFVVVKLYHHT